MTDHFASNRSLFDVKDGKNSSPGSLEEKLMRLLRQSRDATSQDRLEQILADEGVIRASEQGPDTGRSPAPEAARPPGDALAQAAMNRPEPAFETSRSVGRAPIRLSVEAPTHAAPVCAAANDIAQQRVPHVPENTAVGSPAEPSTTRPDVLDLPKAQPARPPIAADFGLEDEHPQIQIPFNLQLGDRRFEGQSLSVTHLVLSGDGQGPLDPNLRQVARLQVHFNGFDLTLHPEVAVREGSGDGKVVLFFTDPTGPHLPQLRYVLNNTISGDVTTLNGLLAYTGPIAPKAAKAPEPQATIRQRVRSLVVLATSCLLVLAAMVALYSRYTTGREMHPVFVEMTGQQMRATAPGQIGYLNPNAMEGDVIFSLNANSGDVLNFVLPCDCKVAMSPDVEEGATVLPSDLILTIFGNSSEIRAKTMISVEGLARAMEGDRVILDLNDGRSLPVEVIISQATSAATMGGGLFVPVQLRALDGALTADDVGKNGRLRITSNVLSHVGLN